ncbi:MAG: TIGR03752 family integrating conjugative element protein, partial [Woeseiaceae bacterium]
MIMTQQNRLLPMLAGIVLLLLVLVLSESCGTDTDDGVLLDQVPTAAAPDADSPADTIKTLTANVAAMTSELKTLRQLNATLRSDNEKLAGQREDIVARVTTRIDQAFSAREKEHGERSAALNALDERINALSDLVTSVAASTGGNDVPIGFGLNGSGPVGDWVWVEPLDAERQHVGDALLQRAGRIARTGRTPDTASDTTLDHGNAATPVYTVPRNATLMGSTAMTALLGRIPKRGEVRDPMPFKVITGRDNLAANGLTIPGVEGMIWSGTAIGDWTLSCVTGRLESVTFVFDDGRIRTVSSDDREQHGNDANRPLGWISDAQGIPCVSGERKSNAGAFLS